MISMINRMRERQDGFTLVELLVVIVILGILIGIAVPTFLSQQDKARESEVKQHLNTAYKVAKSESVSNDGNFVTTGFTAGDLASKISTSEPQLGGVSVVSEASDLSGKSEFAVVEDGTTGQNLKLAGTTSDGSKLYVLTVTGNGQPSTVKAP